MTDDEMHDIMVRPLPPKCRLTAIFDSVRSTQLAVLHRADAFSMTVPLRIRSGSSLRELLSF